MYQQLPSPSLARMTAVTAPASEPTRRRSPMQQQQALIGADRYEEIIETRGRRGSSQMSNASSLDHLQTIANTTMADREEKLNFSRPSLNNIPAAFSPTHS